jgi:hypothetical protein
VSGEIRVRQQIQSSPPKGNGGSTRGTVRTSPSTHAHVILRGHIERLNSVT